MDVQTNSYILSFYYKMVTCAPTMATILINFFCSDLLLSPNNQLRRVHCRSIVFLVVAKLFEKYRFILNIFTHMPYIIGEGEIKTGNTRFHALIQVDLQSFGLKHSQFREYFILNCKKRFDKKWLFFAFSLFTMYLFDRRLETYCPFITSQSNALECFHSRGQHLYKFIGTKESVCIRKEFNSQRTGLRHQHGRRFIVLGHQYGRLDVM